MCNRRAAGDAGRYTASIMDDTEKRSLLKDEYLHVQSVIHDFDGRALTIKGWSVTFSLVALVGTFVSHTAVALLVSSFSACLFWLIEGMWKTFQYAHYDRAGKIERYFAGEVKELFPLQIGASWFKTWKKGGNRRLLRIMARRNVCLPHVLICTAGLCFYTLDKLKIIRI